MGIGVILQRTFPRLVTNWAVQWMVHQQVLHYQFPTFLNLVVLGGDPHVWHGIGRTGCHQLRCWTSVAKICHID